MTFKRVMAALAGCAAVCSAVSATGFPPAASAQERTCASTPLRTERVELGEPGSWRYTFGVTWCAGNGAVLWADPETTYELHSADCAWLGNLEEYSGPLPGNAAWREFNMNGFACRRGGGVEAVNPWGEFILRPDGTYQVRSGVEADS
ncbi:hypothetical protein [Saccharothrix coeruleofusca]|uniref:Peptidase inhibitor family I36 n=1 Tax=Saccharothrix coeruleofusca TaxID=33919 RepID=A0A918EG74_9PSEU|nr:hypothetical protein [Saccharothrix coeruleofusca]MBP2337180.1 hypothetical protein [Saccharothrix coeruleofusca]GGP66599.1 hypothetical protein GCM10010185_44180 [Saccharothrix coeruleofusca]